MHRFRRCLIVGGMSVAAVVAVTAPGAAYTRPGVTDRVSIRSDGGESEELITKHYCYGDASRTFDGGGDITPDGRFVVFPSASPNLVDSDTNLACDVYRFDRRERRIERVSIGLHGLETIGLSPGPDGNGVLPDSYDPTISADGRFVAFVSFASNIVPGDTNLAPDVFLGDTRTGTIARVSVNGAGEQSSVAPIGGGSVNLPDSDLATISQNGRYVTYSSDADNLVEGDANASWDVFRYDRSTGDVARPSTSGTGDELNSWSMYASISSTGRYVSFTSSASNVLPSDNDSNNDTFIKDMKTGSLTETSAPVTGTPASFGAHSYLYISGGRSISAEGTVAAFYSHSQYLVPNDNVNNDFLRGDVFVRDVTANRTERVSVNSFGEEANGVFDGNAVSMSPDGRFVMYATPATNFFHEDDDADVGVGLIDGFLGDVDIYIYDREIGATDLVTIDPSGDDANHEGSCEGYRTSTPMALSAQGRFSLFASCSDDLVPGDENVTVDDFVRDRGPVLGFGGSGTSSGNPPGAGGICIDGVTCIPPLGAVAAADTDHDDLADLMREADLIEARIAFRPQLRDLFVFEELEEMGSFGTGPAADAFLYGFRFQADGRDYEVRATSLSGGTFGLFDCSSGPVCTKVHPLRGGIGTTGERVVFSIPLDAIGLSEAGTIDDVVAYTALGTYATGPIKMLDTLRIDR